jgi:DNA topoisomerase-3
MKRLYIAEKPELARAIVEGLAGSNQNKDSGNATKGDGFFVVGDNIITWCFGHLLMLKAPADYNEEYKKWYLNNLPYNIPNISLKPVEDKGKQRQLNIIGKLIKEADEIVNAGDPDEEGQLLVDEVLEYFNNKKPVLRILINDNTKTSVEKAIANLKDNEDFKGLRDSAYARSVADWEYGLNLTVVYTLKAQENGYKGGVISIGRVQTPILNLVYNREMEVKNHIKELYYNISTDNGFRYIVNKDKLEDGLCKDKEYLSRILEDAKANNNFTIKSIEVKNQENQPPLPYNLLKLQADANRKFKYKPDVVKNITQSLREKHKAITYNRSDCQYLSDEHYEQRNDVITTIKENLVISIDNIDTNLKHKAFNNANITAHHAIIPTINKIDISQFTEQELNIYKMIADSYLLLFLPAEIIEKTTYIASNSTNLEFITTTSKVLEMGWKSYRKVEDSKEKDEEEQENNQSLSYKQGDNANFKEFKLIESATKPKQLYTFATLLEDLTQVAKYVKNQEIKKLLLEKDKDKKGESGGIGTPATRDSIIVKLFERTYMVEEKGKIITTQLGKEFLAEVRDESKQADMTALWAEKQFEIRKGNLSVEEFRKEIILFLQQEISNLKTKKLNISGNVAVDATGKKINCPTCKTGLLVQKKGKFGMFWSCNQYPICKETFQDKKGKPQLIKGVK